MPTDGHVRVLPEHVANKIAAGEVVERPASVVKELVENALDAGARHIQVVLEQGGRKLVVVQDDGSGMTREDALTALIRQATSKIRDVDDIERIDTLGFRGEAIPSIAAVSRFTLITRRADADEGTAIRVLPGEAPEATAAGAPPGTRVEVRDLFLNVPARKKFLRSAATEEGHIKAIFTSQALAHPEVGFVLTVDGRELYRLPPATTVRDRVRELFGNEFLEDLLPLPAGGEHRGDEVRVTGFIERPGLGLATRRDQYVFVNGRAASAPAIAYALKEAYPRRVGEARPAAILFIDLPPREVDVNVHPTKREVRFRDNFAVKRALIAAIEQALGLRSSSSGQPSFSNLKSQISNSSSVHLHLLSPPSPLPQPSLIPSNSPITQSPNQSTNRKIDESKNSSSVHLHLLSPPPPLPQPQPQSLPLAAEGDRAKPWNWFKFLALTDSGYLLVETDAGVVTINPHAARERIAFERLLASDGDAAVLSQPLLIPEVVRLSPPDFARVKASSGVLRSMGFLLEEFGTDTYKVEAVPQLIGELKCEKVLSTIARDLADGSGRRGGERWREELVAKSVARSFAGAAIKLDAEQATQLVEELAASKMPYVCPRGKPVMIFTSTSELDRKFDRR